MYIEIILYKLKDMFIIHKVGDLISSDSTVGSACDC